MLLESICNNNLQIRFKTESATDLLLPDSFTVEHFGPCGLFYSPIHQQVTFFFSLGAVRHRVLLNRNSALKLYSIGCGEIKSGFKASGVTRRNQYTEIFDRDSVTAELTDFRR